MATEFLKEFKNKHEILVSQLNELDENNKASIDSFSMEIRKLKNFLADNAQLITKYDVKRRNADIKSLEDAFNRKSAQFSAKSFTFVNPEISTPTQQTVKKELEKVSLAPDIQSEDSDFFTIANKSDQNLTYTAEQIANKEMTVSNLSKCRLVMLTHLPAVRLANLNGCEIICGPVSTSVFIENAKNCTFVMAAQQFRIHDADTCHFYIHVTSKAIIEACQNLKFAPYNLNYGHIDRDFKDGKLPWKNVTNNWDKIDDFNWPSASANKPSPNWSILAESDRKSLWLSE